MSTGELFPQRSLAERHFERDLTVQEEYVQDLALHAETIPDISQIPRFHRFSPEDHELISRYCHSNYNYSSSKPYRTDSLLDEREITPLFRADIIEPSFCGTINRLVDEATERSSYRWYKSPRNEYNDKEYWDRNEERNSREWDLTYIDYMRQRRIFHAEFMAATLTGQPIDTQVAAIGLDDNGEPLKVPALGRNYDRMSPLDFMYNRTNWVTSSMLSALSLPPEHCTAEMKRRAIELWASHADLDDDKAFEGFYEMREREGPLQLPWSMRSNSDLKVAHHPQWRQNDVITMYLGHVRDERADGLKALLQDRPKDYLQVLILRIFGETHRLGKSLKDLAQVAELTPQVQDIIFSQDASFNTIYSDGDFPDPEQPTTLAELLEADGVIDARTQEDIIQGLRLRVQVLSKKLQETEAAASNTQGWQRAYNELAARNQQVETILEQQSPHLPRSETHLLMLKYNISPAMSQDTETLESVIRAVRRSMSKRYHSDTNTAYEDASPLGVINNELDEILRSHGIQS